MDTTHKSYKYGCLMNKTLLVAMLCFLLFDRSSGVFSVGNCFGKISNTCIFKKVGNNHRLHPPEPKIASKRREELANKEHNTATVQFDCIYNSRT